MIFRNFWCMVGIGAPLRCSRIVRLIPALLTEAVNYTQDTMVARRRTLQMSATQDKVVSILGKYVFNKQLLEDANGNSRIINDLKINSARVIDVILDVEDEFQIEIDNTSLEKILTVDDICKIIEIKLGNNP